MTEIENLSTIDKPFTSFSAATHQKIRIKALDLLARREHSYYELMHKLRQRNFLEEDILAVLARLKQEKLLSDERFTECYIVSRQNKGFGPRRIQEELRQRGVDKQLINTSIVESDTIWFHLVRKVHQKYFKSKPTKIASDCAKMMRFLNSRGFTSEQIESVVRLE